MSLRQRQQDTCFGICWVLKVIGFIFFFASDGLVLCGRNGLIEIDYLTWILDHKKSWDLEILLVMVWCLWESCNHAIFHRGNDIVGVLLESILDFALKIKNKKRRVQQTQWWAIGIILWWYLGWDGKQRKRWWKQ